MKSIAGATTGQGQAPGEGGGQAGEARGLCDCNLDPSLNSKAVAGHDSTVCPQHLIYIHTLRHCVPNIQKQRLHDVDAAIVRDASFHRGRWKALSCS